WTCCSSEGKSLNRKIPLFSCCKKVSTAEITEPIIKFEVQRPNPPCVRAVIFTTQTGHYCSHLLAPWVFQKIQELRRVENLNLFLITSIFHL
uniref:Chemokine interleukin-8-like domain-containing protein n=1 Tax=Xiphophorus maculatus TaxID=8083 RepID=A0A3B5RBJ7_XIPMA